MSPVWVSTGLSREVHFLQRGYCNFLWPKCKVLITYIYIVSESVVPIRTKAEALKEEDTE